MPLVDARRLDLTYSSQTRPGDSTAVDVLLARARTLDPEDRLMLELAFRNNLSVRQIGRAMHRPAGTISRQLRRICARLRDPLVVALLQPACILKPVYREIGIDYFARGRVIRELASERKLSRHEVRAIVNFVRGWHRGVQSA